MIDATDGSRDAARPEAQGLAFERVQLRDVPEAIAMARASMEPRIAAYALAPPAGVRRARLKGWLAGLPWIGGRIAQPERWFWVLSAGRRAGFVQLNRHGEALHLQLIVLDPELRGTGAAPAVMRFVEGEAQAARCSAVDLYVDRRNYRAIHLYRRTGFVTMPERRFIFEVPRPTPPLALTALPRHGLAALLGSASAPSRVTRVPGHLVLEQGLVASMVVDAPTPEADVDAAVRQIFRDTFARIVRVTLPFEGNVQGGSLVAVLHGMKKVLA